MPDIKVAILDLYEGAENQGMRGLRDILAEFSSDTGFQIRVQEFDVRRKQELPDLSFDIFISSGGPGSPLDSRGSDWDNRYMEWLQQVNHWNRQPETFPKKHVFFICHSFQLACRFFEAGNVCRRKSTSFGVFPVHQLPENGNEPVFRGLEHTFYAVDSRDFQVIEPNHRRLHELGARILCIEKARPHVPLERAVMAIRFSPYLFGTQFHPEADPQGMSMYLQREDKKAAIIAGHGQAKWESMLEHLSDPDKIRLTRNKIIPNFLNLACTQLR